MHAYIHPFPTLLLSLGGSEHVTILVVRAILINMSRMSRRDHRYPVCGLGSARPLRGPSVKVIPFRKHVMLVRNMQGKSRRKFFIITLTDLTFPFFVTHF